MSTTRVLCIIKLSYPPRLQNAAESCSLASEVSSILTSLLFDTLEGNKTHLTMNRLSTCFIKVPTPFSHFKVLRHPHWLHKTFNLRPLSLFFYCQNMSWKACVFSPDGFFVTAGSSVKTQKLSSEVRASFWMQPSRFILHFISLQGRCFVDVCKAVCIHQSVCLSRPLGTLSEGSS